MIILLIGPSGVGKTTAMEAIEEQFPNCVFRHLDGLASRWAMRLGWLEHEDIQEYFETVGDEQLALGIALQAIGVLVGESPAKDVVIDVGAGFLRARSAEHLHRVYKTIAIVANPQVSYDRIRRGRNDLRTFAEYKTAEFNSRYKLIYERCHQGIETSTMDAEQVAVKLSETLTMTLEENRGIARPSVTL